MLALSCPCGFPPLPRVWNPARNPPINRKSSPVNLRVTAEAACVLAWYGPALRSRGRADLAPLQTYWTHFRFRNHLWQRALDQFEADSSAFRTPPDRTRFKQQTELLEEILVSELLTRVVATLLSLQELNADMVLPGPCQMAHRTVAEHLTLKHRAIIASRGAITTVPELLRQQRLQRRLDRWTDLLISPLAGSPESARFAVDSDRCLSFAAEGALAPSTSHGDTGLFCLHANALKLAIPNRTIPGPTRAAVSSLIVQSALGLLPRSLYSGSGTVKPRLQRLIDAGIQTDSPMGRPGQTSVIE